MEIEWIILKEDIVQLRTYITDLWGKEEKQPMTYYTSKVLLKKLLADTKWEGLLQTYELEKFKHDNLTTPHSKEYEHTFYLLELIPIPAISIKLKYLKGKRQLVITDFVRLKKAIG